MNEANLFQMEFGEWKHMYTWFIPTEDLAMWTYWWGVSIVLDNGLESMQQAII